MADYGRNLPPPLVRFASAARLIPVVQQRTWPSCKRVFVAVALNGGEWVAGCCLSAHGPLSQTSQIGEKRVAPGYLYAKNAAFQAGFS